MRRRQLIKALKRFMNKKLVVSINYNHQQTDTYLLELYRLFLVDFRHTQIGCIGVATTAFFQIEFHVDR